MSGPKRRQYVGLKQADTVEAPARDPSVQPETSRMRRGAASLKRWLLLVFRSARWIIGYIDGQDIGCKQWDVVCRSTKLCPERRVVFVLAAVRCNDARQRDGGLQRCEDEAVAWAISYPLPVMMHDQYKRALLSRPATSRLLGYASCAATCQYGGMSDEEDGKKVDPKRRPNENGRRLSSFTGLIGRAVALR